MALIGTMLILAGCYGIDYEDNAYPVPVWNSGRVHDYDYGHGYRRDWDHHDWDHQEFHHGDSHVGVHGEFRHGDKR